MEICEAILIEGQSAQLNASLHDSNHRVVVSLHDSLYRSQLRSGEQPEETYHILSPEVFQAHIAWPGVRPFHQGEAAGSGAVC